MCMKTVSKVGLMKMKQNGVPYADIGLFVLIFVLKFSKNSNGTSLLIHSYMTIRFLFNQKFYL